MTRFAYVAAPTFMFGYGVVRLIDGLDGSHGPGPAWTIGHLLFLIALALFGVVLFGLRNAVPGRPATATTAVVAGLVGIVAFVRDVLVDLIVGWRAVDRPDMNRIYPRYDGFPGGLPTGFTSVFDNLGPVLLVVAMLTLTTQLAVLRPRRLSWWNPVLIALGFAVMTVDLDLLPLGGAILLVGLLPMARTVRPETAAAALPV